MELTNSSPPLNYNTSTKNWNFNS